MGQRGSQGLALFRSTFPRQFWKRWVRNHTSGHSTLPCGDQISLDSSESFSVQRAYPVGDFPQLPCPGPPQTWKLRSWDRKACTWGSHPGYSDTPNGAGTCPRKCLPRRKTMGCPLQRCMWTQSITSPPLCLLHPLPAGLLPGLPYLSCAS